MSPARLLLLGSAALLALVPACGPADPGRPPSAASRSSADGAGADAIDVAPPRRGEQEPVRPQPPAVDWPDGWRVLETDGFGREDESVFWYRLEVTGSDAAGAARDACAAVAPALGAAGEPHVAEAESAPGRAVAQLRGGEFRASVDVREESGVLTILVIVAPLDA